MATATTSLRSGSSSPQSRTNRGTQAPPAIALIIYPITLILGSIYSAISPTARQPRKNFESATKPLTPTLAADVNLPPTEPHPSPVNYFARKDNIFNLYFVKVGWAWITFSFLALLLTQPYFTKALSSSSLRAKRVAQAVFRYSLVTLAWFLATQWFFGPAIIDRTFVITGGKCERLPPAGATADSWKELKVILTAAACKAAGGAWKGGHDVSGHVFMLVLGSAFLGFEALGASQFYLSAGGAEAKAKDDSDDDYDTTDNHNPIPKFVLRFVWGIVGLSWWMLFMTAIWFHTWLEKLSGLAISLGVVYVVYILPQTLPPWRNIIGIPGM